MTVTKQWLRRKLGVFDLYALVHADSQSTFYFMLGFLALEAGAYGFFVAVYSVLLMISIALTYGEMGSRFPETGGSYLYVKYAYGSVAAFFSTWALSFDQIIMIGYGTIDAAKVLQKTLLGAAAAEWLVAALISTALFLITLIGIRESAAVAKAVAVLDLLVMSPLIAAALLLYPSAPPYFNWRGVAPASLLFALSLASRGFTGVDAIGQLAGEAREPLVQVPKASLLVIAIGTTYSLGLMAAVMAALSPGEVEDPAVAPLYVAEKIHPLLHYLVTLDLFLIMIMAALAGYVAFSRLSFMLAEQGHLPPLFRRLHKRFRTPVASLAVAYAVSLLLISMGEVEIIVATYGIGSLVNYLMVATSLAKAAKTGTLHGAFNTPLIRGIPLSAWMAMALLPAGLAFTLLEKYPQLWAWALWLAAGVLFYLTRRATVSRASEQARRQQ
ncbi:MAG: APC family permease [Pyrobaculum sp.]